MNHKDELTELKAPKENLAGSVRPPLIDRRRSRRCRTQLNVVLRWLDEFAVVRDCSGILRDISADGFGVETKQPIPVGHPVTVRITAAPLECVVRHVQDRADGFLLGVEILPPSRRHLNPFKKLNDTLDFLAAADLGSA